LVLTPYFSQYVTYFAQGHVTLHRRDEKGHQIFFYARRRLNSSQGRVDMVLIPALPETGQTLALLGLDGWIHYQAL
jgi:hypothetical protein